MNALTHGVYSRVTVLPGEDPAEYEKLRKEVFEEWSPSGITEQTTVMSLVNLMWLVRRLEAWWAQQWGGSPDHSKAEPPNDRMAEVLAYVANNPDEALVAIYVERCDVKLYVLRLLLSKLWRVQSREEVLRGFDFLTPKLRAVLSESVLFEDFPDFREWRKALQRKTAEMIKEIEEPKPPSEPVEMPVAPLAPKPFTPEQISQYLHVMEKIEAMIEKAIRRLVQIKGFKQVLASTAASIPVKALEGPRS